MVRAEGKGIRGGSVQLGFPRERNCKGALGMWDTPHKARPNSGVRASKGGGEQAIRLTSSSSKQAEHTRDDTDSRGQH